jgi:tRNA (adenine57-N1/adenine58-N1)-methyltransferase
MTQKLLLVDKIKFKKIVDPSTPHKVGLPTGHIDSEQLETIGPGGSFDLHGRRYHILDCDTHNFLMEGFKRQTQIIYPKDSAYAAFRMDLGPGKRVGEAGAGSGALTLVLSQAVGPEGRVHAFEQDQGLINLIGKNLERAGALDNVAFHLQNLENGLEERDLDAFFLDMKKPWVVLDVVRGALRRAGHLGIIVPTTNQVTRTLYGLEQSGFWVTEVIETSHRPWKHNYDRFRPMDKMVAHTGFLIFARKLDRIDPPEQEPESEPDAEADDRT